MPSYSINSDQTVPNDDNDNNTTGMGNTIHHQYAIPQVDNATTEIPSYTTNNVHNTLMIADNNNNTQTNNNNNNNIGNATVGSW